MKGLIRFAQKWSHSKIGWLTNKAGIALAGWFAAIGVQADDAATQIAAGIGAFLIALLELGVKWSSNRLVKGIQKKAGLITRMAKKLRIVVKKRDGERRKKMNQKDDTPKKSKKMLQRATIT